MRNLLKQSVNTQCFGVWADNPNGRRIALQPKFADTPLALPMEQHQKLKIWEACFERIELCKNLEVVFYANGFIIEFPAQKKIGFSIQLKPVHWLCSPDETLLLVTTGHFDAGSEFRDGHGWLNCQASLFDLQTTKRIAQITLPSTTTRVQFTTHQTIQMELFTGDQLEWTPPNQLRPQVISVWEKVYPRIQDHTLLQKNRTAQAATRSAQGLVVYTNQTSTLFGQQGQAFQTTESIMPAPMLWSSSGDCYLSQTQTVYRTQDKTILSKWQEPQIKALSDDGEYIITSDKNNFVLHDSNGKKTSIAAPLGIPLWVFSRDSRRLLLLENSFDQKQERLLRCFDTQTGAECWRIHSPIKNQKGYWETAIWSTDNLRIWIGYAEGLMELGVTGEHLYTYYLGTSVRPLPLHNCYEHELLLDIGGFYLILTLPPRNL